MAVEKKVRKKTATSAAKLETAGKTTKASNGGRTRTQDKIAAVALIEKPTTTSPSEISPAAPVATTKSKAWILAVLGLVTGLIVFEMTTLLKNKVDRQGRLTQVASFGARNDETRPEAFKGAIAMKIDSQDRLYLVDPDWAKVIVFDTNAGVFSLAVTREVVQKVNFSPWDVSADREGNFYILDRVNQEVNVISSTGVFLRRFSTPNAAALTVNTQGEILISDNLKMQVVRYGAEGNVINQFGGPGNDKGKFNSPYRLTTDEKGNIYVIDMGNKRVQAFNPQGQFEKTWPLKFTPTVVLGITAWGQKIFINDFENGFIWEYTPAGKMVGQIDFAYPSNFALDSSGNFYLPSADGIGRFVRAKKGQ